MSPRPHLLVVQPVPAYSPPVVAEVILNCRICHLRGERRGDLGIQKRNSREILILQDSKGQSLRAVIRPRMTSVTFSSSKLSVKWRISANCLARACSLSRCCMGAYGGLVNASSRLRKAFSANTLICQKYTSPSWNLFTAAGLHLCNLAWIRSLFLPARLQQQAVAGFTLVQTGKITVLQLCTSRRDIAGHLLGLLICSGSRSSYGALVAGV